MTQRYMIAARVVQNYQRHALLRHGDVVGTAVGFRRRGGEMTDQPVLKIFVLRKRPPGELHESRLLPRILEGGGQRTEIDVEELEAPSVPAPHTHIRTPRPADAALVAPHRPIAGGSSLSHWDFPIGTAAIGVQDMIFGAHCVLSCNHVLARMNQGRIGDAALQPAPDDGGWYPGEAQGALLRFVPVHFDGTANQVDAAIAACWPGQVSNHVHGIGAIRESAPPWELQPGDTVRKVGRSTGLTEGKVVFVDAAVKANYAPLGFDDGLAAFTDQIVVDIPAAYGDSGSLLLDSRNRAVGMLFGGTAHHTWFNPFTFIEHQLQVRLLPPAYAWV
ncbi:MAG: trypsin-like peptidase domain-containing protein [Proteobacteria bacterium]|nr:trypsin-like peptidase domain-containing protein [Pseudomonadota bacterium]